MLAFGLTYACAISGLSAIGGVTMSVFTSRVQTKDYKIGICCFSVKDTPLRRKSED